MAQSQVQAQNIIRQEKATTNPQVFLASQTESSETSASASPEKLQSTFEVFNQLSNQLANSYQHLEQRVMDLTEELDTVSEQRIDELKEKEQLAHRLEVLINVLPGGVVVLDKHGFIIEANPTAESLLKPDLQGFKWRDVIQTCIVPKDDDGHEVSNHQGRRMSIVTRSLGEEGQIILLTDQTETRNLQAELSRNERLSALGKMVSTLAHQVRTPLSSAMLYANHLCRDDIQATQRDEFSHKLVNRLNYMERQVRDMLLFVKGDVPIADKVSVEQLQKTLAEAIEMPIKAYKANCHWEYLIDDCAIRCNLDAVSGALLNLVNNSLQASKEPADITIRFEHKAHQLHITILDSGEGVDPAIANNLNTMFFTTKEQGTGIGLSVVRIVAQSHGGSFSLTNREEGGACACLALPLCG